MASQRLIEKQSPRSAARNKEHRAAERPKITPKTLTQQRYLNALHHSDQVVVLGPAGTGKTYLATVTAVDMLQDKRVFKIVLTRPNVPSGRSLGAFPGTVEEKMAPWTHEFTRVMVERGGQGWFESQVKNENIEVVPFEVMRGRTFDNAFIILDEAQNTTPEEMRMFLTRIGENSRVVVNGDVTQTDLVRTKNGLVSILDMVHHQGLPVDVIEFGVDDVVRSGICRMWTLAFHKLDQTNQALRGGEDDARSGGPT